LVRAFHDIELGEISFNILTLNLEVQIPEHVNANGHQKSMIF